MQSTSIQDFPPNSKRRLELQNQHNLQYQQQQQQLQQQMQEPPFKKRVTDNFFYKVAELAAYTSTIAVNAFNTINTITGSHSTKPNFNFNNYDDEILQFDDDDENDFNKLDKKHKSSWSENVEDEEPPPPYDNSWSIPTTTLFTKTDTIKTDTIKTDTDTTTKNEMLPETKPSLTISTLSSSPSQQDTQQQNLTSQKIATTTQSPTNPTSRRRQFRVRRGRRLIRRKSSSVDMTNSFNNNTSQSNNDNTSHSNNDDTPQSENNVDEEEDIFLKFNCKLSDMIAEGQAALTSTVEVTELEMLLAEEKEREERIMKEFGINRRTRTNNFSVPNYNNYSNYVITIITVVTAITIITIITTIT
ncbi:hypothetical protein GLOIN_2v1768878 [Rhizophagus clarus]|uniref:Uncharacterized protein n=1 Tax=Rhizophagus clarus TaxID=94130 RepID=A0A8H3QH71_9GLOM|nr:hypothetical protein GLOIN_2v1768878 [Rhizophagus clarus]